MRQSCSVFCSRRLRICDLRIIQENFRICYLRPGTPEKFADFRVQELADFRVQELADLLFADCVPAHLRIIIITQNAIERPNIELNRTVYFLGITLFNYSDCANAHISTLKAMQAAESTVVSCLNKESPLEVEGGHTSST